MRNDLDPENLKALGKRKGTDHNILELLPPTGEIPLSNWMEIAKARGIPNRTFERLKKNLVDEGKVSLRETPGRGSPKMVGRTELIDPDPD